ncbi:MAG: hypothetical protein HY902_18405 [Deltaproteobacteria bacterium]|nr:hypothetical protein [Deltaproteobacteria bacterium]
MDSYTSAQDAVRAAHGISRTGAALIESWEAFVEECATGYSFDIAEYRNELRVRNEIEVLVSSERLRRYKDHDSFVAIVRAIDERFKALGHATWHFATASTWWERVVPVRAGHDFASYCLQVYGFRIKDA